MTERVERAERAGHVDEAVLRFIERITGAMERAGTPRMPARVFSALLVTDSGRLTAAELAELLRVSPAAISGAVRYLDQLRLVIREREPGARRDHYAIADDVWYEASVRQDRAMDEWIETLDEGIALLGRDTPAGARLAETMDFLQFLRDELADMLDRWAEHKARRDKA